MDSKEFNIKCAEYMGYKPWVSSVPSSERVFVDCKTGGGRYIYNPYDDMNQLAEVVDKVKEDEWDYPTTDHIRPYSSIKQALRDFITTHIERG